MSPKDFRSLCTPWLFLKLFNPKSTCHSKEWKLETLHHQPKKINSLFDLWPDDETRVGHKQNILLLGTSNTLRYDVTTRYDGVLRRPNWQLGASMCIVLVMESLPLVLVETKPANIFTTFQYISHILSGKHVMRTFWIFLVFQPCPLEHLHRKRFMPPCRCSHAVLHSGLQNEAFTDALHGLGVGLKLPSYSMGS